MGKFIDVSKWVTVFALAFALVGCGDDKNGSAGAGGAGGTGSTGNGQQAGGSTGETGDKGDGESGATGSTYKTTTPEQAKQRKQIPDRVVAKPRTNINKYKPVVKVKIGMDKDDVRKLGRPFSIRRPDNPPGAKECWFYRSMRGSITMVCFQGGEVFAIQTFPPKKNTSKK